jgi:hypothetical protein
MFNLLNLKLAVQAASAEAPVQPIKMEVGIEDCLHIEFEYDKQKYHLKVKLFISNFYSHG